VNDEDLICPLTDPPLSSIRWPTKGVGQTAAALLDRLIAGRRPPRHPTLVPPPGIAIRTSTDCVALADPRLAGAMRLAREQAPQRPVAVGELAAAASMSLRTFVRRFGEATGRSPHEEVARIRAAAAMDLLNRTDLPIQVIADRMGFPGQDGFSRFFKLRVGSAPREFRERMRRSGASAIGPGTH